MNRPRPWAQSKNMNIDDQIEIWLVFFVCFVLISLLRYSKWHDRRLLFFLIIVANILLGIFGLYIFVTYPSNDVLQWSAGILFLSAVILIAHS
jgi:hypothetical protein